MKILFLLLYPGQVRYYDGVVKHLAQNGYRVHLAFNDSDPRAKQKIVGIELAEQLSRESHNISYGPAPGSDGLWSPLARAVRLLMDYVRYFGNQYTHAYKLKRRISNRIPRFARFVLRILLEGEKNERRIQTVLRCLRTIERVIPCPKQVRQFIEAHRPDIVLVTPLVNFGSEQVDYVKSAKKLGIPSALCVLSWDNLTNKGLIRLAPDRVIVWNEIQKSEAINLHGIPACDVIVTGAQCYDDWFVRKPSTSREEFCRKAQLVPDRHFVLYLASSKFISPHEVSFVRRWIEKIRQSREPYLKSMGILIRPHPLNADQWKEAEFSHLRNVSIWPREGEIPAGEKAKANYFDSLYHCAAVVGLNTSALIEAGIVGREVFTILSEEFKDTQAGTLHFHYLVEGGLLHTAKNLDEHIQQLTEALQDSNSKGRSIRSFVEQFVRPHGISRPCAPIVAEAVVSLADFKTADTDRQLNESLITCMLFPLAGLLWCFNKQKCLWRNLAVATHSAPERK
jgi:hypothetical protein